MVELLVFGGLAAAALAVVAIVGFVVLLLKAVLWVVLLPFRLLLKLIMVPVWLTLGAVGLALGAAALPVILLVLTAVAVIGSGHHDPRAAPAGDSLRAARPDAVGHLPEVARRRLIAPEPYDSSACAAARSVVSSNIRPVSCTPIGSPAPFRPAGMLMAGRPVRFALTVNTSLRYI